MDAPCVEIDSPAQTLPRRRPDLVIRPQQYEGQLFYLVKDPIGLRYFRFQATEHRILELLDGRRRLEEIREILESEFRPRQLSLEELQQFVARLQSSGLLLMETPGRGSQLYALQDRMRRRKWRSAFGNILYVKLDGFDPEPMLNWLYPKIRWFFSPWGVGLAVALMLTAVGLIGSRFDEFLKRPELLEFQAFFNLTNLVWLWLALGVSKIIHEFGHGLMCKHFGGECHDMGVLFMVFTPCLYCNVSDAWMMPNKWHRIAVSLAGMYVELVLASLATFVWWGTNTGVLHSIAFSVMLVCSANTLLMNANPLLRFDGYYVLSDLVEMPNLRRKAAEVMQYQFTRRCLGLEVPPPAGMPTQNQWLFGLYSVASYLYRWLLSIVILWFLYNVLKPYKLGSVSAMFAGLALISLIVVPAAQQVRIIRQARRSGRCWRWTRFVVSGCVLAGGIAAFVLVPLPLRVSSLLTIEPEGAESVFVPVPGRLMKIHVQPRQRVRAGDVLAELTNPELEKHHRALSHEAWKLETDAKMLFALDRPAEEHQTRLAIEAIQRQLVISEQKLEQLTLRASRDGLVLPPPPMPATDGQISDTHPLPRWSRDPLEPENLGCYLETGTHLCTVADPSHLVAVVILAQSEIEYLEEGQSATIKLDAIPDVTVYGSVREISVGDVTEAPVQLGTTAGGNLPLETNDVNQGRGRLLSPHYRIQISLDRVEGMSRDELLSALGTGFRGQAWIDCGRRTAWQWLWRVLNATFQLS